MNPAGSNAAQQAAVLPAVMSVGDALVFGTRLHRLGQLDAARRVYESVLAAAPRQPDALQFMGLLRYREGQREAGIDLVRQSIAACFDAPGAHVNLGNMLLDGGDVEAAADAYQHAVAMGVPSAELMNNLGVLRRHQGRLEEAEADYRQALAIEFEFVDAHNNLGHLLAARGEHENALKSYCQALALHPTNPENRRITALALGMLGRTDAAADIYREWLADEPHNPLPRHYLAACTGEAVPERASDAYVEATFDSFATSFDAKLALLTYRAPGLVADAVAGLAGAGRQQLDVLDAGCGTGLCGPLLAPWARRLVGVDLSGGMLARAAARGGYDTLVKAELGSFLDACADRFDLVVSADTLCYFGPLDAVVRAAYRVLRPGAWLVFTVEALAPADAAHEKQTPGRHKCFSPPRGADDVCRRPGGALSFLLQTHGRYSHSPEYVDRVLRGAGLEAPRVDAAVLRNEGGRPVRGLVAAARRPAMPPV